MLKESVTMFCTVSLLHILNAETLPLYRRLRVGDKSLKHKPSLHNIISTCHGASAINLHLLRTNWYPDIHQKLHKSLLWMLSMDELNEDKVNDTHWLNGCYTCVEMLHNCDLRFLNIWQVVLRSDLPVCQSLDTVASIASKAGFLQLSGLRGIFLGDDILGWSTTEAKSMF